MTLTCLTSRSNLHHNAFKWEIFLKVFFWKLLKPKSLYCFLVWSRWRPLFRYIFKVMGALWNVQSFCGLSSERVSGCNLHRYIFERGEELTKFCNLDLIFKVTVSATSEPVDGFWPNLHSYIVGRYIVFGAILSASAFFVSVHYLLNQLIDSDQTCVDTLLGGGEELFKFWWPRPYFQGHSGTLKCPKYGFHAWFWPNSHRNIVGRRARVD